MQVARPVPSFSRQPKPCLEAPPPACCPTCARAASCLNPPSIRPLTTTNHTAVASAQAGTPRTPFRIVQYPGGAATAFSFPCSARVCCNSLGGRGAGASNDDSGSADGSGRISSTRRWARWARVQAHAGPFEVTSSNSETDGGGGEVLHGPAGGGLSPQEIISMAEEYVDAWWRGVARGTEAAAESLSRLVAVKAGKEDGAAAGDGDLVLMPDGVLHKRPLQGYEALLSQLAAQHTEYHRVQYRPVSRAASTVSSCGYVLGEYRMQDVGGLAGHPATFRVSRGFCLFKLRVDPRSGRITRGWVRRQLTQEERDERVWDPVHVYPAPFPLERVHLTRDGKPGARIMEEAACTWVAAQAKHITHPTPPPQTQHATSSSGAASRSPSSSAPSTASVPDSSVTAEATATSSAAAAGDEGTVLGKGGASGAPLLTEATDGGVNAKGTAAAKKEDGDVVAEEQATMVAGAAARDAAPSAELALPAEGTETAGGNSFGGGSGGVESISTAGMINSTAPEISSISVGGSGGVGGSGRAGSTALSGSVNTGEAQVATKAQRRLVDSVLAPDCRLLDAYGMWPGPEDEDGLHTSPPYSGTYGGQRPQAVVGASRVLKRIQAHQKRCERIEPLLYDVAVSEDHNVVFVHWVNLITPAPEPVAAPSVRQQRQHMAPAHAHQDQAPISKGKTESGLTRREASGGGEGRNSNPVAVAASATATAAATAASAAAQVATVAADVATTAASAANVAANTANTAATIAATAATVAAFVVGDVTVRASDAAASVTGAHSHPPGLAAGTASATEATPHDEGSGKSLSVVTSGAVGSVSAGSEMESSAAAAAGGPGAMTTESGGGDFPRNSDIYVSGTTSAGSSIASSGSGSGGPRLKGLQDLRISIPTMPPIPQMPPMPQFQSQIQNIEEVLTAAAQRVAGAAGTAAAAASAAAAAASAVIKAEAAASGGGAAAAAAITNGASSKDIAAAADAKVMASRKPTAPPPVLPYNQECMAALLINDDGTVSDVWLFRGPYHFEKKLLRP